MKSLKTVLLYVLCAVAVVAAPPAFAKKTLWQILFPYNAPQEDASPDPSDTLQAPFFAQQPPAAAGGSPLNQLYSTDFNIEGSGSGLEKPNRYHKEVAEWLVRAISEVFNLQAGQYDEHMKLLATGMDAKALSDFEAFSQAARIRETLQANDLKMNAFVEEEPILLNQGPVAGRYRWLFEMPVLLTFLPRSANSYEKTQPVSQRILVTVQVGRMPRGQGIEDLMIESFMVRKNTEPRTTP